MWVILLLTTCSSDDENPLNGYPEMSDPDDFCTSMSDANFISFCYENFDINGDGKVSVLEAKAVNKMEIKSSSIISVWGIQYFDNLTELYIDAPITFLDISKFTKLIHLRTSSKAHITFMDLSNNKTTSLFISSRSTYKMYDISNNLNLDYLDVGRRGEYVDYAHLLI